MTYHITVYMCMTMYTDRRDPWLAGFSDQSGVSVCVSVDRCEDKDPQCGANPGWPQSWCTDQSVMNGMMIEQINEKCPKMCGHCR